MIHGEKDVIPLDMVRAVFERAGEPKKLIVYDCLHTDLYVREPWLTQSADAAIEEAFKQANLMYLSAFPDFETTVEMIVAENDLVMVYGPASGTNTGPFLGKPPTGKKAHWTGIAIYRFNDEGKIDGRWQEFDGLGLFTQLGIIPPMGGAGA
jgi:predicted ester cyclase